MFFRIFECVIVLFWFLVDKADFLFRLPSTYMSERKRFYMEKTNIHKTYKNFFLYLVLSPIVSRLDPSLAALSHLYSVGVQSLFLFRVLINVVCKWTGWRPDEDLYYLNLFSILFRGRELTSETVHRESEFQLEPDFNKTSGRKRETSVSDNCAEYCKVLDEGPHFNRLAGGCLLGKSVPA
ncbi:hypothetical protein ADEAN_000236200 [Angomonas deanei]|uniref:Uncharacterized protein n=1 Tax=Angomonas deanei TaxID=59799 RepID=A0A7G2C5N9_9TRYP|nr:hypothetical protein ADEAN_000236200 [Angomonas deanei]